MPIDPLKSHRILIVDDEQTILDAYKLVLAGEEHPGSDRDELSNTQNELFGGKSAETQKDSVEICTCQQGADAVENVREALQHGRPFSVVLMDVRMPPGIDGVTAAEQIRQLDQNIQIVIVTAYSDVHPRNISLRVPPLDKLVYLQKPVEGPVIQQLVLSLCARWRSDKQARDMRALAGEIAEKNVRSTLSSGHKVSPTEKVTKEISQPTPFDDARGLRPKFRAIETPNYLNAAANDPIWSAALGWLGVTELKVRDREQRLQLFSELRSLSDMAKRSRISGGELDNESNLNAIGLILKKRPDEAVSESSKSIDYNPGDSLARLILATALTCCGRSSEAQLEFKHLEQGPNEDEMVVAPALAQRARSYLSMGELDRSIEVASNSIKLNPGNPIAHHCLASALWHAGETEAARRAMLAGDVLMPKMSHEEFDLLHPFVQPNDREFLLEGLVGADWVGGNRDELQTEAVPAA